MQNLKEFNFIIEDLEKANFPFNAEFTTLSKRIIYNERVFKWNEKFVPMNELFFISMFKNNLITENIPKKLNKKDIIYTYTDNLSDHKKNISNVYEIDLNSAYYNFALKNNFIDEKTFNRGLSVSKITRLAAIGSTAKNKYIYEFDGNDYNFIRHENSPLTENAYFKCALDTSLIMQELTSYLFADVLFFWVDALFVKGEAAKNEVIKYLTENNLPFKIKKGNLLNNKKTAIFVTGNKKKEYFKKK